MIRVAYWGEGASFGGVETHLIEILSNLDRRSFEPTLFCRPVKELVAAAQELDVPVHALPPLRGKLDLGYHAGVVRALRRDQSELLHVVQGDSYTSLTALGAAKRLGKRGVVVTVQRPSSTSERLYELVRRLATSQVDLQIAPSAYVIELLTSMSQRRPRLELVRNGIGAIQPVTREHARAQLGLRGDRPAVGAALRLVGWKRAEVIVEAARELPDVDFVVLGDGPERERLERLAQGTSVRFLGFQAQAGSLLGAFDVFVHPTPTEPQGIAVLEAMAAGVPVVVADSGGAAESVEHERTGLLALAEGPAFAAAIRRLLDQPELARRLSAVAAEEIRTRFSSAAMTRQLERLYNDVLGVS
ncbi:MAG: hypothetical protein QOE36_1136 [Gaiellaceae bacterium]|nr:hypothetical protein [Gaiellaceae bacterium]